MTHRDSPIRFDKQGLLKPSTSLEAQLGLICDALRESDQDYIPTKSDFENAYRQLGILKEGQGSSQKLHEALRQHYLNANWIKATCPWATPLLPYMENPDLNPKIYAASLMWLQDQLRTISLNIHIIPKLVSNGFDDGLIYTQAFEPSNWNTTAVILPGDYASPFHYSEMGLWLAQQGIRTITLDEASGAYSTGYKLDDSQRTSGWGDYITDDPLKVRGLALRQILQSWSERDENKKTVLLSHSGGVFQALGYLKNYSDEGKQLAGLIMTAPGFKLTPEKKIGLWFLSSKSNPHKTFDLLSYLKPHSLTRSGGSDLTAGLEQYYDFKAGSVPISRNFNHFRYQAELPQWWEHLLSSGYEESLNLPVSAIHAPADDTHVDSRAFCDRLVPLLAPDNKVRLRALLGAERDSSKFDESLDSCGERDKFERTNNTTGSIGHLMNASPDSYPVVLEEIKRMTRNEE